VEAIPLKLPEIAEGDDIARLIVESIELEDGDIIAICSTVISKAEGRLRKIEAVKPTEEAIKLAKELGKQPEFVQVVLEESDEVFFTTPFILTRAKCGNICVNAGVDNSNVREGYLLLLPENPDKSAEKIRKRILELTGKRTGIIITDTNGRPFRKGVVGFAIGSSGVEVLKDWRGEKDLYGRALEVTVECIADEIAAFANLLMGEGGGGIPAVVIRGLKVLGNGKISDVYRSEEEDVIAGRIRGR
jgi:coenzyme F420-0:L-glutamate ligase/coenzyme F420-1:gamma-L-glutamate ligase